MSTRSHCRIWATSNDYLSDSSHCSRAKEDAIKYLCLVYHEEARVEALSESEYEALMSAIIEHREEFQANGRSIASGALDRMHTATLVRVRGGNVAITEGPFVDARDQLSGFVIIDARDLNDAIRLASRMPSAHLGAIEVRPIKEFDDRTPKERRNDFWKPPG